MHCTTRRYQHDLLFQGGQCRVLAYCPSMAALVISQPSANHLFPGFGIKKVCCFVWLCIVCGCVFAHVCWVLCDGLFVCSYVCVCCLQLCVCMCVVVLCIALLLLYVCVHMSVSVHHVNVCTCVCECMS